MRGLVRLASGVFAVLFLASCANGPDRFVTQTAAGELRKQPIVGVILPDQTSSSRWENQDRPLLTRAFRLAGIEPMIENANGDEAKFASIADDMIRRGVKVLMITSLSHEGGVVVGGKAQRAGIPVIDYDRVTLGGLAEYYVSFDHTTVGELQADGLISCLGNKPGAQIIEMQGSPSDNNATQVSEGQLRKLGSKYDTRAYRLVGRQAIDQWNPVLGKQAFDQLLRENGGRVDGVVASNDGLAGAVIEVLRERGLAGKVPVTGQDATLPALRAILRGDQCMTVYKPIRDEAEAAARLAIALAKGDMEGADDLATGNTKDPVSGRDVKSILLSVDPITKANVRVMVADRVVKPAELCAGDVAPLCAQNDIVVG